MQVKPRDLMALHYNITSSSCLTSALIWLNYLTRWDQQQFSPQETLKAHISIIPKEGKDRTSCGSYRPISFLNVDLKLFTRILASQLQQRLPQLVHLDQGGFIPIQEARDNTVKVLNLIHVANTTRTPRVFLGMMLKKHLTG